MSSIKKLLMDPPTKMKGNGKGREHARQKDGVYSRPAHSQSQIQVQQLKNKRNKEQMKKNNTIINMEEETCRGGRKTRENNGGRGEEKREETPPQLTTGQRHEHTALISSVDGSGM
jgi:hypothetical protein